MIKISIAGDNKLTNQKNIKQICRHVLEELNFLERGKIYLLDIAFIGKDEMRRFNREFRGIDRATSALAFPFQERGEKIYPLHLGHILLCEEVIKKRAFLHHKRLVEELTEVLVHALLHICGYTHSERKSRKKMMELQSKIITSLGGKNVLSRKGMRRNFRRGI